MINSFLEDGVQELYDPTHNWCNYPNKVDCGDRPICDENDDQNSDHCEHDYRGAEAFIYVDDAKVLKEVSNEHDAIS